MLVVVPEDIPVLADIEIKFTTVVNLWMLIWACEGGVRLSYERHRGAMLHHIGPGVHKNDALAGVASGSPEPI